MTNIYFVIIINFLMLINKLSVNIVVFIVKPNLWFLNKFKCNHNIQIKCVHSYGYNILMVFAVYQKLFCKEIFC